MSKEDIGITVSKETNFSEWYTQIVLKAKLADYAPVKGLIVLRPDGYSIWESLRSTFDEKFSKNGICFIFFALAVMIIYSNTLPLKK
mgnify:CR=1 FL=1